MTSEIYQPVVVVGGGRTLQLPDFQEHPVVLHNLSINK